jgi:hypothetical protein
MLAQVQSEPIWPHETSPAVAPLSPPVAPHAAPQPARSSAEGVDALNAATDGCIYVRLKPAADGTIRNPAQERVDPLGRLTRPRGVSGGRQKRAQLAGYYAGGGYSADAWNALLRLGQSGLGA